MMVLLLESGVKYFMPHLDLACLKLAETSYTKSEVKLTLLAGKSRSNVAKILFLVLTIPFLTKLQTNMNRNEISVAVGAVTGATAAIISCPMEVATVRMSNDATLPAAERRNYKGVADVVKRIHAEEGVAAFWRGSMPFAQRAALVGVFQVATLDQFKEMYAEWFNQKKNSVPNVFCAAMTSGLIYSIVTMPLEASKNRMANQKPDPKTGKLPYTGTLQLMKTVAAKEGFLALYNGFLPYYLRCGGHTVSMFIIVQMLRDVYTSSTA